jgi:hypothetical protein
VAKFGTEDAVSLLANCSAHVSDDVIRLLTEAKVRIITFPSHTTQIFQVLNLTLFGVLKKRPRYELPFEHDNATVKCMIKVYHDFRQTMVAPNRWMAFHALGLDFDMRRESYRLLFDEERLRGSARVRELCSVDFSLDQLLSRGRAARFSWINKPE